MTDQTERRGYTVGVYFPPEAPDEVRETFFDRIAFNAHRLSRNGWDPLVVGLAGDPLYVNHEPAELSERAKWYLENFTPEQVAEFAAAQEAEVVVLCAGGEPYDDERVVPTPGQWITLFNRATAERRLQIAASALTNGERADHCFRHHSQLQETAEHYRGRITELTAALRPTEEALTRVLRLAEVLPAETGTLIRAAIDGKPIDVRVEQDASFLTDEVRLSVRYPGGRPVETLVCNECGKVRHLGLTCEEAAADRHPLGEWLAREVDRVVSETCGHQGPKRGSLFAVSSEDVADARLGRYAGQGNTQLRPETLAALGEAMQAGTAPRRLMVRKQSWWAEGCAGCGQLAQFCDCLDGEAGS